MMRRKNSGTSHFVNFHVYIRGIFTANANARLQMHLIMKQTSTASKRTNEDQRIPKRRIIMKSMTNLCWTNGCMVTAWHKWAKKLRALIKALDRTHPASETWEGWNFLRDRKTWKRNTSQRDCVIIQKLRCFQWSAKREASNARDEPFGVRVMRPLSSPTFQKSFFFLKNRLNSEFRVV